MLFLRVKFKIYFSFFSMLEIGALVKSIKHGFSLVVMRLNSGWY
jgi:hypothetical protein